jgi:hypothetical protein
VFPTLVATKHSADCDSEDVYVLGPTAEEKSLLFDISHPVKRGVVNDWSQFEQILFGCLCQCDPLSLRLLPALTAHPSSIGARTTHDCLPAHLPVCSPALLRGAALASLPP